MSDSEVNLLVCLGGLGLWVFYLTLVPDETRQAAFWSGIALAAMGLGGITIAMFW